MEQNNMIITTYDTQEKVNGKWVSTNKIHTMNITLEHFISSFVDERWKNERRLNKQYSKFGYYHTKTIVNFDDTLRSVRTFTFPT